MASEELIRFVCYYLAIPFCLWIGIIIFLAAIGKSFGVRALYIKILLIIFEWGREKITTFTDQKWGREKITTFTDQKWGKQRIKIHEETHPYNENSGPAGQGKLGRSFSTIEEVPEEERTEGDLKSPDKHADSDNEEQPHVKDVGANGDDSEETEKTDADSKTLKKEPNGHLIDREIQLSSRGPRMSRQFSINEDTYHEFKLGDIMYFCKSGIESIVEDEVTQRFSAEELSSWNLLTRTNTKHEFISVRLTLLWFAGWVLRYIILLPFRAILALYAIGLFIFGTALIGRVPNPSTRKWLYHRLSLMCYRVMGRGFSAIVTYHNKENRAKGGGICVANHTSPIDIIILGADNTYAMVGQNQTGFIGVIQRAMSRAEKHVWFERGEAKDRSAVAKRLSDHVEDVSNLPILIFPEGTCINNTSIMMFKKGSFEVGGTIYPVAIKYDPRFADAFWNSSQEGFVKHLLMIMTSWALVCDVWYLPPEKQLPGEDAVEFANRVKSEIARQGGLVDLEWDGGLKRSQPKPKMMEKQQEEYSKKLKGE